MPEISYDQMQEAAPEQKVMPGVPSSLSVGEASQLGESGEISYTEPKPKQEPNLAGRVGQDVVKPFVEAQRTIGAGMYWLGDNASQDPLWGKIGLGDRLARAGLVLKERATKNLQDNYSNFTPNMFDTVVGAVPSLAAFIGATYIAGAPMAVGGMAVALGAGVSAENYGKFKEQGWGTAQADLTAMGIGGATGGVAALGFHKVAEMTSPWLSKVLGDSIGRIAGGAAAGAAGMGSMTATEGTLELASGATPYTGKDSLIELMTSTAKSAVLGGILGGAQALPFAFKQYAAVEQGFRNLGLEPGEAKEKTRDLLAQTSHVVMDKLEKQLAFTQDEQNRIKLQGTTQSEVRPDVLDRRGIPLDSMYPPVEQEPLSAEQVAQKSAGNKYVRLEPIDLKALGTDKETATNIRERETGKLNAQLARGAYLKEDIKLLAPGEENAIFWHEGANSDRGLLQRAINEPEKFADELHNRLIDKYIEKGSLKKTQRAEALKALKDEDAGALAKKLTALKPDLEKALNLSDGAQKALSEGRLYYKEAGDVASQLGTIKDILENYQSHRLYKPAKASEYVKALGKTGLPQFSSHSLERFYDDPFLALAGGKEFASTDYADLISMHNQEMAVVNHARQLADAMSDIKPMPLGHWVQSGTIPDGWRQVGDRLEKVRPIQDKDGNPVLDENGNQIRMRYVFAAPDGIAEGLKPLVDPDFLRRVHGIAPLQKLQGLTKTGILSYSLFHHITFATQTLASLQGWKTLADMPVVLKDRLMQAPEFRQMETDFLEHTGVTTKVHDVQDILRGLNQGDDALAKVLRAPVAKQLGDLSNASSKLLFDGMQRWLKVTTYAKNVSAWMASHAEATPDALREAKLGYAKATNAEFGGLNWEALGFDKTQQSIMRTALLAPDWVTSMVLATKYAFTEPLSSTAGQQARGTLFKAVLGGLAAGNALNYMRTGHFMGDNKKGHKFEIEIAPDIYVAPIRGATGELIKLLSNIYESGGAQGAARYAEGKLSPLAAAGVTLASGVNYYGGSIWRGENALEKNVNGIWNIVSRVMPVPLSVTGAVDYSQREQNQSPLGWGAVVTGSGRFSKPSGSADQAQLKDNVIQAFKKGDTNFVDHLINKGDVSQEQAIKWQEDSTKSDAVRKVEHMKIEKAMTFYQKLHPNDRKEIADMIEEKYENYQNSEASPNEKARVTKLYQKLKENEGK